MRSRDAILRATLALIEADGFEGVTVTAVARAAGVTRQTVYNAFGSREALVSEAVASVAVVVVGGVAELAADAGRDTAGLLGDVMVSARRDIRAHPVLARLLVVEPGNPIFDAGMMERAEPIASALLAPIRAREPGLADDAAYGALVELVTRLSISILFFDSAHVRDDDGLRRFFARTVAPLLPG